MAEYDVTRRFQTRGVRQSDNSYRDSTSSHDVRFGGSAGAAPASRASGRRVKAVTISGDAGDESQLRDLFKVEAGRPLRLLRHREGVYSASRSV